MTDWEAVRVRIQARRRALGLSQAALGAMLGTSGNTVAQVEGGLPISEKKLDAFAEALGVSTPFLRYGLVTPLDRAAIETEAFEAGRTSVLTAMRGWLGREEHRTRQGRVEGGEAPGGDEAARYTAAEFTPVTPGRRAEAERRRTAAADRTTATSARKKNGGRGRPK